MWKPLGGGCERATPTRCLHTAAQRKRTGPPKAGAHPPRAGRGERSPDEERLFKRGRAGPGTHTHLIGAQLASRQPIGRAVTQHTSPIGEEDAGKVGACQRRKATIRSPKSCKCDGPGFAAEQACGPPRRTH